MIRVIIKEGLTSVKNVDDFGFPIGTTVTEFTKEAETIHELC